MFRITVYTPIIAFRTAQGEEAIRRIAKEVPDVLVGAGTVLTTEQVDRAIDAGAKFIVSPGLNREPKQRFKHLRSLERFLLVLRIDADMRQLKDTAKKDAKGKTAAIYLKDEIAGFAIHLVQKKK